MRNSRTVIIMLMAVIILAALNLPSTCTRRIRSDVSDGLAPLERMTSGLGERFREAGRVVRGIGSGSLDYDNLIREIIHARREIRRLQNLRTENERLREMLSFRQQSTFELMPCEVIARDISGWWQTARLGKGRLDGIQTNMAVISVEGVIGRTLQVSRHTADVLLLSDPQCRVSARITRTGSTGILYGRGVPHRTQAACRLDFVSRGELIRVGDDVYTSGLGGVFPEGLLIGYVEEVGMDEAGLYQTALVVPAADLSNFSEVFAVRGGGAEARP